MDRIMKLPNIVDFQKTIDEPQEIQQRAVKVHSTYYHIRP